MDGWMRLDGDAVCIQQERLSIRTLDMYTSILSSRAKPVAALIARSVGQAGGRASLFARGGLQACTESGNRGGGEGPFSAALRGFAAQGKGRGEGGGGGDVPSGTPAFHNTRCVPGTARSLRPPKPGPELCVRN